MTHKGFHARDKIACTESHKRMVMCFQGVCACVCLREKVLCSRAKESGDHQVPLDSQHSSHFFVGAKWSGSLDEFWVFSPSL